jgi:hypothetical protein
LPTSGCTENSSAALTNSVTEKTMTSGAEANQAIQAQYDVSSRATVFLARHVVSFGEER